MIYQVDPKKKVEVGSFRISGDGTQEGRKLIPYARSNEHLSEVVDTVCKNFEDYAQATAKASGEPTIIRLMTIEGNMNPKMSEVDIVPDDDLNTRLKFYCENIVEDQEETILQLFPKGLTSVPPWSPHRRNMSSREMSCRRSVERRKNEVVYFCVKLSNLNTTLRCEAL